ncbi:MAG: Acetyltransferase family protein [Proteobacteria bacterium]|nr:Acetyltransferase family protein [Pseudomonadota bacterium]
MVGRLVMENLILRQADSDDLPRIAGLKIAMFTDAGLAGLLAENARYLVKRSYQALYAQGLAAHFVANEEGEIVAMAGAFIKSDLPYCYYRNPRYGFIGDVYTRPDFRRRGLARELSNRAIGWLRDKGLAEVKLLASESGRRLYESLGFTASDEMRLRLAGAEAESP